MVLESVLILFFYVVDQFSQHHLLKRLSILHCILLPPLSKIRCQLLHNKGNCKQGEKTALRLGENSSKGSNGQRLISKIYKQLLHLNSRKIKDPIKKCAKELNRHFSKEDIQIANKHEKMLNITHYQRNANQNHNEVSFHTSQDGYYPKAYKQ